MAVKTFDIEVLQNITVKLDEEKFTPEFMDDFRRDFYPFDTVEDHARHLAQLAARGVIETPCFIEGYGFSRAMGIEIQIERA